jgi:hypothetical protein
MKAKILSKYEKNMIYFKNSSKPDINTRLALNPGNKFRFSNSLNSLQ